MTLRSFMSSVSRLPLYAAETGAGSGGGDPTIVPAAADASPPAAGAAAAAVPQADAAAAIPDAAPSIAEPAAAPQPEFTPSEPSLLEATEGKKPAEPAGEKEAVQAEAKPGEETPAESKPAEGEAKPDAAAEPKPGEAAAEPAQVDVAADEPPAVVFDAFTFPEGVKADDGVVSKFTEVLGSQTSVLEKAIKSGDRAAINKAFQDVGQQMVDFYSKDLTGAIQEQALKHQKDVWDSHVTKMVNETKNDPDLGGARINTSLAISRAVIEEFGGTKDQIAETIRHLTHTGTGNFLGMIRVLNNIGQRVNIFEDSIVPAPAPQKVIGQSRTDKWYGNGPTNIPG